MQRGERGVVLGATLGLACVALCLVAVTDHRGAAEEPVALVSSGWGVRGVAEMASHVLKHANSDGWNLNADSSEEDTGYLHMFDSPVSQLAKSAAQADNTDCLEHDCPGAGASSAKHESEAREEAQEAKEEEAQIARQARTMNKFAKLGFAKHRLANVPRSLRALHPHKSGRQHSASGTLPHFFKVKNVDKLAEKRHQKQKALMAAQHALKMQKPHLPSISSNALIRKLDKIAPLPGMHPKFHASMVRGREMHEPRHAHMHPKFHASMARGRGVHEPGHAQEKGMGLLKRLAMGREEKRQKMLLEEKQVAHHKLEEGLKKLI